MESANGPASGPAAARAAGDAAPRRPRLAAALLLLAWLLVAGLELGTAPVTTKREDRCHDIVRNMLDRGDWVVPWRLGGPWINKPPLFYWTVAAASSVAGGYSLGLLRLPSLLGGAALLLLALHWGHRLGGWRAGLLAAALLAPMKGLHDMAREGSAEMLLAALCGWALSLYDEGLRERRSGRLWWWALLVALAILTKATVALLVIGAPIAVDLASRGALRRALTRRRRIALAAALAAGFAWYLWILAFVPGTWERLFSELVLPVGVRTPGHTQTHYGPPTEHFGNLLRLTLPVLVLLPLVVWRAVATRMWRDRPGWRFVAVVLLSLFVAFSLLPKKRTDYLLPLLPFVALLMAESTLAFARLAPVGWRRYLRGLGLVVLLAGAPLCAAVALWYGEALGGGLPARLTVGVLGGGLLLAALVCAWRGAARRFAVTALLAWGLGVASYQASMEVHQRLHIAGAAGELPGYDAARWEALRQRYPELLEGFEPDPDWVANRLEQPGAEAVLGGEQRGDD